MGYRMPSRLARLLALILVMSGCSTAYAVDWLRDAEDVFNQMRAIPGWSCSAATNIINGEENALECEIEGTDNNNPFSLSLTATPSQFGPWIAQVTISVSPLDAATYARVNEHYMRLADVPYRTALLRNRFPSFAEIKAICERSERTSRGCQFSEREQDGHSVSIVGDTEARETFLFAAVDFGKPARCASVPACVEYYAPKPRR